LGCGTKKQLLPGFFAFIVFDKNKSGA